MNTCPSVCVCVFVCVWKMVFVRRVRVTDHHRPGYYYTTTTTSERKQLVLSLSLKSCGDDFSHQSTENCKHTRVLNGCFFIRFNRGRKQQLFLLRSLWLRPLDSLACVTSDREDGDKQTRPTLTRLAPSQIPLSTATSKRENVSS